MNKELKKNALTQLIHTPGEQAKQALEKELSKIAKKLEAETLYDKIEDQLEFLKIISPRLVKEAIKVYQDFLRRLKNIELTYPDIIGISSEAQKKYRNSERLTTKIIESLGRIRYFVIEEVFEIFLEYSVSQNEEIKKASIDALKHLSEYNLDAIYKHDNWPGIGFNAQKILIEKIQSLKTNPDFLNYLGIINSICQNILSPTMSGTSWDYKAVMLSSAQVPANDDVKKIRNDVLSILQDIYRTHELTIPQKLSIISTLNSANGIHSQGTKEEFMEIVYENVREVLRFFQDVIKSEKLQVMQKIEHETYWFFYRRIADEQIQKLALEIREYLLSHEDYQIYRVLVGFESVFEEWEDKKSNKFENISADKFKKQNEERQAKALEYAESINANNFATWEDRIIRYLETESNDLATFPLFAKFLEHFCKHSPDLGMRLMSNNLDKFKGFLPCFLLGLWSSNKNATRSLIKTWIEQGIYLLEIARIFEFTREFDEELLKEILIKAVDKQDGEVLKQLISSVAVNYDQSKKYLVSDFFIPAIEALNKINEAGWIFYLWYRIERNNILSDLGNYGIKIILSNLQNLNSIDYQAEEILSVIAKSSPEQVIEFFITRLGREKDYDALVRFDAIPYEFYKLHLELSKVPNVLVKKVRQTYDGKNPIFMFKGAKFLKNIFPDFPKSFELELDKLLDSKDESDISFVLYILRNYDGQQFIHSLCRKIIMILPENHQLLDELKIVIISTDVTWGEYGLMNAYQEKKGFLERWLSQTENEKVRNFAQSYILALEKQIQLEKKRVDDSIEVMKYEYGDKNKE